MENDNQRIILATRSDKLPASTCLTSFIPMGEDEIWKTLNDAGLWLGPRATLEEMPEFRQIIPYIVLKVGDQYVHYTRTPKGGEERLHGKVSIGLGGHVDLEDIRFNGNNIHLVETLNDAARREVMEEIGVGVDASGVIRAQWVGLVAANITSVDFVHIGVVAVWELPCAPSGDVEDALSHVGLDTAEALLMGSGDRLETWSALYLNHVRGQ